MVSNANIYDVKTKRKLNTRNFSEAAKRPDWPTHIEKPSIDIGKASPNLSSLYNALLHKMEVNLKAEDEHLVAEYLVGVFKLHKHTLKDDWLANKILIGKKGTTIDPTDLLTITRGRANLKYDVDDTEIPIEKHRELMARILGQARLEHSKGKEGNYFAKVKSSINAAIKSNLDQSSEIEDIGRAGLFNDGSIIAKLCCVFDMLARYSEEDWSWIRIGTVTFYQRDNGIIKALADFPGCINATADTFYPWIWSEGAQEDLVYILSTEIDIADFDGYIPYAKGLGVWKKSPLSLSANPSLSNYLNVSCALDQSTRGLNQALITGDTGTSSSVNASIGVYLKTRGNIPLSIRFASEQEKDSVIKSREEDTQGIITSPTDAIDSWKEGPTAEDIRNFHDLQASIVSPRPGTIGDFLKKYTLMMRSSGDQAEVANFDNLWEGTASVEDDQ